MNVEITQTTTLLYFFVACIFLIFSDDGTIIDSYVVQWSTFLHPKVIKIIFDGERKNLS